MSYSSDDILNPFSPNFFCQAFSPVSMPSLSHLNLQGNPLDQISAGDLFRILSAFTCLQDLEVPLLNWLLSLK